MSPTLDRLHCSWHVQRRHPSRRCGTNRLQDNHRRGTNRRHSGEAAAWTNQATRGHHGDVNHALSSCLSRNTIAQPQLVNATPRRMQSTQRSCMRPTAIRVARSVVTVLGTREACATAKTNELIVSRFDGKTVASLENMY